MSNTGHVLQKLTGHGFLAGISAQTIALLSETARNVVFEAGSVAPSRRWSGGQHLTSSPRAEWRSRSIRPHEGHLVIDTIEPGHIVGLSWVAPPFRWQFDARALTNVEAVVFDARFFGTTGA